MINKVALVVALLFTLVNPANAGIDRVFGKKTSWWTSAYDSLMSNFGIGRSYAIVIGIGSYNDKSFAHLPSEKDAKRIKDYLINEAGFDQVRLITGEKVTVAKVRKYMLDVYPKLLKKHDRFLFYWSGHGITAGQSGRKLGYLALKSSSVNMFSTMVSMKNLAQWDRAIKARQTLYLLDSCFSGIAASKAMSVRKEQTIERVNQPSRQVLTAGLEDQQTLAINDIGGGVFTRALLDGLRGHADTDKGPFKKDGIVTIRELEEYVRERVNHERRRVGWTKPITPQLYSFSASAGDFFFISDKRIVKVNQLKLTKNRKTKVVATGIKILPSLNIPKKNISSDSFKNKMAIMHSTEIRKYNLLARLNRKNFNHDFKKGRKINQFIVHNDGTATDTNTGLMWKRCPEGLNGSNCSGEARKYASDEAISIFKNIVFVGFTDWRLPTVGELSSLINCHYAAGVQRVSIGEILYSGCDGKNGEKKFRTPTINTKVFPHIGTKSFFTGYSPYQFLTTTKGTAINFHGGHINSTADFFGGSNVLLVRSIR